MPEHLKVRERTDACLSRFVRSFGREIPQLTDRTNLLRDLAFTSDDGVDFVLELCDDFEFQFPNAFNPFVHDDGKRGRRFGELVREIEKHLAHQEATHG